MDPTQIDPWSLYYTWWIAVEYYCCLTLGMVWREQLLSWHGMAVGLLSGTATLLSILIIAEVGPQSPCLPLHVACSTPILKAKLWTVIWCRPDNWARTDLDFGKNWLYSHSNQSATVLKKPLVVEEFGKAFGGTTVSSGLGATQQDQVTYYNLVYALVESSFNNNGIVQGLAFWRWSAAQSPGTSLAAFDNSATISKSSNKSSCPIWTLYCKYYMEVRDRSDECLQNIVLVYKARSHCLGLAVCIQNSL